MAGALLALGLFPSLAAARCAMPAGAGAGVGQPAVLLPRKVEDRQALLRSVAFDATIYGLPAYL